MLIFVHRVASSPQAATPTPKVARKDSGVDMAADGADGGMLAKTGADVVLMKFPVGKRFLQTKRTIG